MIPHIVTIVLAAAPVLTFDRDAAVKKYVKADCRDIDVWRGMWNGMKQRSPCEVLHDARPADFQSAVKALSKAWALPEPAAAPLLEAELFNRVDDRRYRNQEVAWAFTAAKFEAALEAAPKNEAMIRALAGAQGDGVPASTLETALRQLDHPAPVAVTLMRGTYDSVGALAAVVALNDAPERRSEISVVAAEEGFAPSVLIALSEHPDGGASDAPAALAAKIVADLFVDGLPERAFEFWRSLPPATREAVLAWKADSERQEALLDPRVSLALAAYEADAGHEAVRIAPKVAAPDWSKPLPVRRSSDSCGVHVQREALVRLRDPSRAKKDPFDFASGLATCNDGPDFALTYASLLGRTHPSLARTLLRRARPQLDDWQEKDLLPTVREFSARASADLLDARKRRTARLESELSRLSPPDGGNPVVAKALATAPRSPWTEKPLPKGVAVAPGADVRLRGLTLPEGFWPVRADAHRGALWVVAASQRLDPMGEAASGGYWLFRSVDDGGTFDAPIYTGLRELQPYEVPADSKLPLFHGESLQLEVHVRELDRSSIRFPPIRLGFSREAKGLFVETTLDALTRDGDGDGLSDLIEQRLLLDPSNPDSDGDGLKDAVDPFPNVASRDGASSKTAELLSDLLHELDGDRGLPGHVVGSAKGDGLKRAVGTPQPIPPDSTTFLLGEPADYAGVLGAGRYIVLTEKEVERASKELGLLYPTQIEILLDAKKERAQIKWSESWRGGSFDARYQDGRWVLTSTGEWIT